jgi:hypothetical protein
MSIIDRWRDSLTPEFRSFLVGLLILEVAVLIIAIIIRFWVIYPELMLSLMNLIDPQHGRYGI